MREIPRKNYFILAILSILTVIIVLALLNIYNNYKRNLESYISQNVLNANSKDLNSLLLENNILFVYVDSISNTKDDNIEKQILDKINEYDLKKYVVFYNNMNEDNINYFLDKYKINIKKQKMLIVFEDGILTEKINLNDNFENEAVQLIIAVGALND